MLSVGEGPQTFLVDPEDEHEREEVDIDALIRKIEEKEESVGRSAQGDRVGTPGRPPLATLGRTTPIGRLTEYKNKSGDVSSVLAFDDVTGMKLEAGEVIEARAKEVQYVRDMRVYDKIPRAQAARQGWKIIKTRWIDINKGDDDNPKLPQ